MMDESFILRSTMSPKPAASKTKLKSPAPTFLSLRKQIRRSRYLDNTSLSNTKLLQCSVNTDSSCSEISDSDNSDKSQKKDCAELDDVCHLLDELYGKAWDKGRVLPQTEPKKKFTKANPLVKTNYRTEIKKKELNVKNVRKNDLNKITTPFNSTFAPFSPAIANPTKLTFGTSESENEYSPISNEKSNKLKKYKRINNHIKSISDSSSDEDIPIVKGIRNKNHILFSSESDSDDGIPKLKINIDNKRNFFSSPESDFEDNALVGKPKTDSHRTPVKPRSVQEPGKPKSVSTKKPNSPEFFYPNPYLEWPDFPKVKKVIEETPKAKISKEFATPLSDKGILSNKDKYFSSVPRKPVMKRMKSFLESLSKNVPIVEADASARMFRENFKTLKVDLTSRLFKLFNEKVFANVLPTETDITWNVRMLKSAGHCKCKKVTRRDSTVIRSAVISLSAKVLDSADRLRDTLIHEMCHAANWIVEGEGGHGPTWRNWANKAMRTFPELPPISRCHNYSIESKYTYRCRKCGYSFGRHSKSLDMDRKRCGHCHGEFELLVNRVTKGGTVATPKRSPKGFALFVRDNYKQFKTPERKHGDVMRELGQKFSSLKVDRHVSKLY